jgi:hypothetical protein
MSTKYLGAAQPSGLFALAFIGTWLGTCSLSACSAGSDSTRPPGSGGSAQGATSGNAGAANPSSGGASLGGAGGHGAMGNGGSQPNSGGAPIGGGNGAGGNGDKPPFDANSADPNRNQVPGGQVCERIAAIQCAGEAHCCDAPGRTKDECVTTMTDGCKTQLYLDDATMNPVAGYDEASAVQIFTDYETKASNCDTSVTAWGATVQGLRGLFKGTFSAGQPCTPPGYPPNVPSKPVAAAYLASCEDPANTACLAQIGPWTCQPRVNAGGSCFTDANCTDSPPLGLYCDNPNLVPSATNKCKTRKADGATCKLLNECQSLLCKQGTCATLNQQNAFCLND